MYDGRQQAAEVATTTAATTTGGGKTLICVKIMEKARLGMKNVLLFELLRKSA